MHYLDNLLLNTDSYKASHWLQYPPGTDASFFYVESRGGLYEQTVFFGLQSLLKDAINRPVTHADIDDAKDLLAAHGEPFNEAGWRDIVDRLGGQLPIRIRAVPEGAVVPTHNVLMTIESTDAKAFWVPSYLETLLLRVWYPVTVATVSWQVKQIVRDYLERTSDDPEGQLPFKLHDFGARGVSSLGSAALGGAAHLVNFLGTDTLSALLLARAHYHTPVAGYSIPAAEHSTITSWGREREVDAYRNMLRQFARPGSIVAVVSDSYDIYRAIREHWGTTLREEVIASGATVVIRPDSGDPVDVVEQCLLLLDEAFGHQLNGKGYKVLNHVRVIQGDGINPTSLRAILERITAAGYAADNVAFGMGGALLQKVDRDTQKFALKCSAVRVDGQWVDVYKDPITDQGKQSKRGRLTLLRNRHDGSYRSALLDEVDTYPDSEDALVTVWENGVSQQEWTLEQVRARADAARRYARRAGLAMHASIDDIFLLPASALLARLRAAAPHLQRRVPLQDDASRWHTLRIGGRTYRAALPITFTPYASVRPCSARCGFCSENLRQHRGGRAAATLRPGPAYFQQLSSVLQLLRDVPLSYSLSGLEMTDDAAWLQTLLQTLATTPNGPRIEQRVLYSNGAGLARADGARLIEALVAFGLSWVELSHHHPLQERNDAIMRFRPDEPIADVATFVQTARRLAARLPLRLVCIVQRGGVDNADAIAQYIAWARSCGASQVIFRELSRLDDAYRSNGTLRYIGAHRVGVDTLLAECMQQPWWSRWQPDGLTEGYYFWNVRLRDRAGLQVVFESADYAAMHARHATGDLYKLVFFANGRLCAGWDPDADVLWEPIDG